MLRVLKIFAICLLLGSVAMIIVAAEKSSTTLMFVASGVGGIGVGVLAAGFGDRFVSRPKNPQTNHNSSHVPQDQHIPAHV